MTTIEERISNIEKEIESIGAQRNREIPIRSRTIYAGEMSIPVWFCPCCNYELSSGNCTTKLPRYCPECGQRIEEL